MGRAGAQQELLDRASIYIGRGLRAPGRRRARVARGAGAARAPFGRRSPLYRVAVPVSPVFVYSLNLGGWSLEWGWGGGGGVGWGREPR